MQKLKEVPIELTKTCNPPQKKQLEYIQGQTNKIENSVENKQSRLSLLQRERERESERERERARESEREREIEIEMS